MLITLAIALAGYDLLITLAIARVFNLGSLEDTSYCFTMDDKPSPIGLQ